MRSGIRCSLFALLAVGCGGSTATPDAGLDAPIADAADPGDARDGTIADAGADVPELRIDAACEMGSGIRMPPAPIAVPYAANHLSLALLVDRRLYMWGNGFADAPSPFAIDVAAIAVREYPFPFIDTGGRLLQFGLFFDDPPTELADLAAYGPFAGVAQGGAHLCALGVDGRVTCSGNNRIGQIGDPATAGSGVTGTHRLTGLVGVAALGAGVDHSCAVLEDGTARCWGNNYWGTLGDGSMTAGPVPDPRVVTGLDGAVEIDGGGSQTCARRDDGGVLCWGLSPPFGTPHLVPLAIEEAGPSVDVSVGQEHACSVLADGSVTCWGTNGFGVLGNGTFDPDPSTTPHHEPAPVLDVTDAVAVSASRDHTCALHADGRMTCWGANQAWQSGWVCDMCFAPGSPSVRCALRPTTIEW